MPCYCYIVKCADGTYYTGWTTDPERRVKTHNAGRGAKYTKMRLPVELIYVEEQPDKKSALKRELAIKKLGRQGKMKLMRGESKQARE
jgi:putative endonuclease